MMLVGVAQCYKAIKIQYKIRKKNPNQRKKTHPQINFNSLLIVNNIVNIMNRLVN